MSKKSETSTGNWIKVSKAAHEHDVKSSQIHSVRLDGEIPEWMEKRGTMWYVNTDAEGFHLHLRKKIKKSTSAKFGHERTRRRADLKKDKEERPLSEELAKLEEASIQAELSKPITALRLEKLKIEQQETKLQQQAGDLISRHLADFLYIGYLDRFNREFLSYQNKLEADFEKILAHLIVSVKEGEEFIASDVAKKFKELIVREGEEIIRNIKGDQLEALRRWAKENGIQL